MMDNIIAQKNDRIRAFDYDPKKTGEPEVYLEGTVIELVSTPYLAYKVKCDKSTFTNLEREGEVVLVPVSIASHEFDGRVVNLSQS
jgi:hypothetical protein